MVSVSYSLYSPVTDHREVDSLLEEMPIALDRDHFNRFVLGFPRKYLVNTPRIEIVKHYLLMESLAGKSVISSLFREGSSWKLCVVTRDRKFLFSRIAGTLSYFGMNIVSAEAFANATSLVLDTFYFSDNENYFAEGNNRQSFQHFLEEVVEGKIELEPLLKRRWNQVLLSGDEEFSVHFDDRSHPLATRLTLECPDHFGLLYLVTRVLSEAGCDIEMAYVETPAGRAHDQFYLTCNGLKLSPAVQDDLRVKLTHLAERMSRLDPELI